MATPSSARLWLWGGRVAAVGVYALLHSAVWWVFSQAWIDLDRVTIGALAAATLLLLPAGGSGGLALVVERRRPRRGHSGVTAALGVIVFGAVLVVNGHLWPYTSLGDFEPRFYCAVLMLVGVQVMTALPILLLLELMLEPRVRR